MNLVNSRLVRKYLYPTNLRRKKKQESLTGNIFKKVETFFQFCICYVRMRYIRIGYIQGNDLMTHDSRHRHKNNSDDTFTNVAYY